MTLSEYIQKLNMRFKSHITTEHSFRGDLQNYLESQFPDCLVTNEPTRIDCGAPDYIITQNASPLGYIEAKDIDKKLDAQEYEEQFNRYKSSLPNLIITNYLSFEFYRNSVLTYSIDIAKISENKTQIIPIPDNFSDFENCLKDFFTHVGTTIKNAEALSKIMAEKAKLVRNIICNALDSDILHPKKDESILHKQFTAFKNNLIYDITSEQFSDIYAQTITYGMFAARLNDPTISDFSRAEAATLIPKSNPFLRFFFNHIAGIDLDERIDWVVEELVDAYKHTDLREVLKDFGKSTQQNDPIIHFYETFLKEYDPKLRKARGVYYTPLPVVNFIVRAVDDILKTEFDIPLGLADISKIKSMTGHLFGAEEKEYHRVQILDPATGTGTFLAEIIKLIYNKQEGSKIGWSEYVSEHLIPRLNGFELLMTAYAMAHLKLDLLLKETNYKPKKDQRFNIFLTNSLEEIHPHTDSPWAEWLTKEADAANSIKKDVPVMVILGNPPYSGESSNKGKWIMNLLEVYKKEPGGKDKLNERNPKWINDDYVKFLRYGQHYIEKNGSGILAFINPHGFLDNPTFRGMRWNLLKTYDKIYTLDLHGNTTKKEISPDGSLDQNVFDIMQGVSINIFVKTGKKNSTECGKVFNYNLFGKRDIKYDFLFSNSINNIEFKEIENLPNNYNFIHKNFSFQKIYNDGISVNELFPLSSMGIVTSKDAILVNSNLELLLTNVANHFHIKCLNESVQKISYRPFDDRFIYYDSKIIERAREKLTKHFLYKENLGLIYRRQQPESLDLYIFCSNKIIADGNIRSDNKGGESIAPLYLYPMTSVRNINHEISKRIPNLNIDIIQKIENFLNITFTPEKETTPDTFAPIDILDYIYAVLHSPSYREKYKEFLKIDFPRVPYPTEKERFWQLVKLGGELRQIHLLESPVINKFITKFNTTGFNLVDKVRYSGGSVYFNDYQCFEGVPEVAWNFYIGGYQPAQKWLKDRKGRTLSDEDIKHYQKIIVALTETDRIMKEIDIIGVE